MLSPLIVVDQEKDWAPYASGPEVVSAGDYLTGTAGPKNPKRVINLCDDGSYQSAGYYVSLLAEARSKRALPSVRTLLELHDANHELERLRAKRGQALRDVAIPERLTIYFGRCPDQRFAALAAAIFTRYPAPILHARLVATGDNIVVDAVKLGRIAALDDSEQTHFAEALDHFSRRVWRASSNQRNMRYDLAILVDPEERMPPSNRAAIKLFERAARDIGFEPEIITPPDAPRLLEFDALLIRCTTAINHFTYQMARQAAKESMAVIDDPESIMRCCNKVFLHDLLQAHRIGMPPSRLVMRHPAPDYDAVIAELGLPLVLKIPDGSFSRGVFKVESADELAIRCNDLLSTSAVIIAQAFVPTPFDWRIGVLEGRALYACRYHMASGHWQIYNHNAARPVGRTGLADGVPLGKVPSSVLRTAVKAARLIGNGLYGVDLKDVNDQAMVIEINDNPSLDAGVEDQILGEELYRQIVTHLMNTVQSRGKNKN
jgi:glutathione synthase/RimK-type ligase-like ATP-grasp enzyme